MRVGVSWKTGIMRSRLMAQGKQSKASSPLVGKGTKKRAPTQKEASVGTKASARPVRKKVQENRMTLVKLRAYVDDLESRLKQANTLTQSSVKALAQSYETLNARAGHERLDQDENSRNITQYIEQLSAHLTGEIEKTRKDIAHDLTVVLDDPRLETLRVALSKANRRLSHAEQEQAISIGKINTQIADLALVIDERLNREVRMRQEGQEVLRQQILDVETQTSQAISSIGEKIVDVSNEFTQQTAERSLEQRQEIEEYKSEISRRMEALEDDQRNTIPSLERQLLGLSTRLETFESAELLKQELEKPLGNLENLENTAPLYEPLPTARQPDMVPVPEVSDAFSQDDAFAEEMPSAVTPPDVLVAAAPMQATGTHGLQEFVPQEYSPQEEYSPSEYVAQEYVAQEYAPQAELAAYAAQPYTPQAYNAGQYDDTAVPPTPSNVHEFVPPFANSGPPPLPGPPPMPGEIPREGSHEMPNVALSGALSGNGASQDALPLHDISSAENMADARPGVRAQDGASKGSMLKKLSAGSGRSLFTPPVRMAALMVGVALIGLLAFKTFAPMIMGTKSAPQPTANPTQSMNSSEIPQKSFAQIQGGNAQATNSLNVGGQDNPTLNASAQPGAQSLQTIEAVGDYTQGQTAPDVGAVGEGGPSAQSLSLQSAVTAGDPVAQYQMGLIHLEAGRDKEAVRLMRLAANQGQPAAQYRLGKLYEVGIGVEADGQTAMSLLERSAQGGNRIAMHDLGHYFATGAAGITPNVEQAVKWFSQAADRGVMDSQFNLGVLYQGGSGVEKNNIDAYVWFSIAAAQGDKVAGQRAELLAGELNADQLALARSRAKAFAPTPVNKAANGVFENLPWTLSAQASNISDVKIAQKILSRLGYQIGRPDGAMGPKTRSAIVQFERANGMRETGQVNAALLERLTQAAGA
jgi:localization factor PodJL